MTRRSRKKTGRKNRRMGRRTFLLGAGAAVCAAVRKLDAPVIDPWFAKDDILLTY